MEILETKGIRGGIRRKSSQQYLEQLYAPELKTAPILKPTTPKVIPKPTKPITYPMPIKTQEGLPLMVGGTGLREIPYVGTGMYEV